MGEAPPWIAVVDDDPAVLKALSRLLRSYAFRVHTYGSTQEFLDSLPDGVPKCVIVDLQIARHERTAAATAFGTEWLQYPNDHNHGSPRPWLASGEAWFGGSAIETATGKHLACRYRSGNQCFTRGLLAIASKVSLSGVRHERRYDDAYDDRLEFANLSSPPPIECRRSTLCGAANSILLQRPD